MQMVLAGPGFQYFLKKMSKKKGQKMGLNDFLNSGGATNWADDVIELPSARMKL